MSIVYPPNLEPGEHPGSRMPSSNELIWSFGPIWPWARHMGEGWSLEFLRHQWGLASGGAVLRIKLFGVFGSLVETVMELRTTVKKAHVYSGTEEPPKERRC